MSKGTDGNDVLQAYGCRPPPSAFVEVVDEPKTLSDVHTLFQKWLGKDYDLATLDAMLAVAASERLSGDPPWLLIISGPGNAKTETVQATSGIGATVVSTLTSDAALLSGTPKKSRSKNATGGLLRRSASAESSRSRM
jgi:hypothetical protein